MNELHASALMTLTRTEEGVFILELQSGVNKANAVTEEMLEELNACLDAVDAAEAPKALVLTARGTRFFSGGFDMGTMMKKGPRVAAALVAKGWMALGRLLVLGTPTVAAINGHAFGAGLFFALACDHRIMAKGQARACLPEIRIGLSLSDGLASLAQAKMPMNAVRTAAFTGRQWDAQEAVHAGFMDSVSDHVREDAIALAAELLSTSVRPAVLTAMKHELFGPAYTTLSTADPDHLLHTLQSKL